MLDSTSRDQVLAVVRRRVVPSRQTEPRLPFDRRSATVADRWDGAGFLKIALIERNDGRRAVAAVAGDHLLDLTDWVGPLGHCPLASFLGRAAEQAPSLSGERMPFTDVTFLPPALGSAAPLCVGLNYSDHARENQDHQKNSGRPALFTRYWSSLTGHDQPIVRPQVSQQLDYEGELVVVIGQHCRAVPRERALEVVAGYTVGQEGSVRDWQRGVPTVTAGKNFWRSGAMGPWMVTADEIPDPSALRVTTTVNGRTRQESPTSHMVFDVPALIAHITTFMPLEPGDTIFTGTPAGTCSDRGNTGWLAAGDTITVNISGIGKLTNDIVDEVSAAHP